MKTQKILAVLVLLTFVMVQCTKEHTLQTDEKSVEMRSDMVSSVNTTRDLDCLKDYIPNTDRINTLTSYTIKDLPRLIAKYGGNASEWAKVVSKMTYTGRDGFKFSTHWYEMKGIWYEIKTVIGH